MPQRLGDLRPHAGESACVPLARLPKLSVRAFPVGTVDVPVRVNDSLVLLGGYELGALAEQAPQRLASERGTAERGMLRVDHVCLDAVEPRS
jgi:hypothetical protein